MDPSKASEDLAHIRRVVDRAGRRIDPHLFHVVHWGAIVLFWYPLANLLEATGRRGWLLPLGAGALLLGGAMSAVLETRLKGRPRVAGANPYVERQVLLAIFGPLAIGAVLSAVAPWQHFIPGPRIPSLWGLVYAIMAWGVGIAYTREWLWAGAFIFAGTVASLFVPDYAGYVLGPTMGLGVIVPGAMAERRVKRMREEDASEA